MPLALALVISQVWARNEARKMLALGYVSDDHRLRTVSRILATTRHDLEAADLYRRIQDLPFRSDAQRSRGFWSKRNTIGTSVMAGVMLLLLILSLTPNTKPTGSPPPSPVEAVPDVVYEIIGNTRVDVTLANPSGGIEQYSNLSLPNGFTYWSFPRSYVYISAQNQNRTGTVTVNIYVRGVLFKSASSSGAYTIATALGYK